VNPFAAVRSAAAALRPRWAVVFGSGLAGAAADFTPAAVAPYADVPGLAPPTVAGHRGQLAVGTWAGVPAVVFFGRIHYYEGHPWDRVTRPIHLAAELGVRTVVLTNAAGGLRADLNPGDLMAIHGHLTLLDQDAWRRLACRGVEPRGSSEPTDEPRGSTPRHAPPYSPRLLPLVQSLTLDRPPGIYAALTGPSYETPAEIRALTAMGADAVGMSTAKEAEAAAGLGLEVVGVSTITNKAAGLSAGPLSHAEVEETARHAVGRLGQLLGKLLAAG
jgi:purine-nucleoside phosphorylase